MPRKENHFLRSDLKDEMCGTDLVSKSINLFHTKPFTQRSLCTEKLLHTASFDTKKLLHRKAFTHRKLLHRSFYTKKHLHSFYTQKPLHSFYTQRAFTQRSSYTGQLLHREAFIHRKFLHTEAFTQQAFTRRSFSEAFTRSKLSHRESLTHRSFYTQQTFPRRIHQNPPGSPGWHWKCSVWWHMLIAGEAQRNPRPWKVRLSHLHLFVSTHLSGLWIARLSELISDLILVSSPFSGCNQERDHPLCCFFSPPPKAAETPVNQIKPSVCKPC